MQIPMYQVDAFTNEVFKGNPAAVCLLDTWLEDPILQAIAAENNLSETAFCLPRGDHYELRWFTPKVEVDLCGHATLACAHVISLYVDSALTTVRFKTQSGDLSVTRQGEMLAMDFPARPATICDAPAELLSGLKQPPKEVLKSRDYLVVYDSEAIIRDLSPDMNLLAQVDATGICVTALGGQTDFVSRFFAPRVGIDEDPVTGSAHCTLIPYWAERLGKNKLSAAQLSSRGGMLMCEHLNERVQMAGQAVTFFKGSIHL